MKRGVALLWVLILSMVFLTLSGTMVGYMIKEAQSTVKIQESTRAYTAAKTGIEWAMSYLPNETVEMGTPKKKTVQLDDSEAEVVITQLTDDPETFRIESTGIVNKGPSEVKRKIEQETSNPVYSFLYTGSTESPNNFLLRTYKNSNPPTMTDITNNGSFDFVFDFWGIPGGDIGLRNSDGTSLIYLRYKPGGKISLRGRLNGVLFETEDSENSYLGYDNDRDSLKAQISYLKDNAITLTITQNYGDGAGCKEVLTLPINSALGVIDFDRFYTSTGATFDTSVGYPSSIKASGTYATYFLLKQ